MLCIKGFLPACDAPPSDDLPTPPPPTLIGFKAFNLQEIVAIRGLDRIEAPCRAGEFWPTPREDTRGTHRSSLFDRLGNPRPFRPVLSFIRSLSHPTARLPEGPASPEPWSPSCPPESAGALTTMASAKMKRRSMRPGPAQSPASQLTCSNLGTASSVASKGQERSRLK